MRVPQVGEVWTAGVNNELVAIVKSVDSTRVYYYLMQIDDFTTYLHIQTFVRLYEFHKPLAEYMAHKQFDEDLKSLLEE